MMRAVFAGVEITTEVIGEVAGLAILADNAARDLVGARRADAVPFGT